MNSSFSFVTSTTPQTDLHLQSILDKRYKERLKHTSTPSTDDALDDILKNRPPEPVELTTETGYILTLDPTLEKNLYKDRLSENYFSTDKEKREFHWIESPFTSRNYIWTTPVKVFHQVKDMQLAKLFLGEKNLYMSVSKNNLFYKLQDDQTVAVQPKNPLPKKEAKKRRAIVKGEERLTEAQQKKLEATRIDGLRPNLWDKVNRLFGHKTDRLKQEFYLHKNEMGLEIPLVKTPYPNVYIGVDFSESRKSYREQYLTSCHELSKDGRFLHIPLHYQKVTPEKAATSFVP